MYFVSRARRSECNETAVDAWWLIFILLSAQRSWSPPFLCQNRFGHAQVKVWRCEESQFRGKTKYKRERARLLPLPRTHFLLSFWRFSRTAGLSHYCSRRNNYKFTARDAPRVQISCEHADCYLMIKYIMERTPILKRTHLPLAHLSPELKKKRIKLHLRLAKKSHSTQWGRNSLH